MQLVKRCFELLFGNGFYKHITIIVLGSAYTCLDLRTIFAN